MGEDRFGFGRNWEDFIARRFSDERVRESQAHMLDFLGLSDLRGRSFLDIGSGSGLHSLAAFRAGAERIFSFDYDEDSVRTTAALRASVGNPDHWAVEQGSVLDASYMGSLEPADVVYSWGVLHHTGEMWQAVDNATIPLSADGVFYVALYTTDVFIKPTPEYWLRVKRRYNEAGPLAKRLMEWSYAWRNTILPSLLSGRNPIPVLRGSDQTRGMSYWTDVRDWLGGWPMEFASIADTKERGNRLGLELLNIAAGEANTEYLFRRRGAANYWDGRLARQRRRLDPPFQHLSGYAYSASLPEHEARADSEAAPRASRLMLYEDGVPVGFAHQPPSHVAQYGGGRYCHRGNLLTFSATDNTDPNGNAREYCVDFPAE